MPSISLLVALLVAPCSALLVQPGHAPALRVRPAISPAGPRALDPRCAEEVDPTLDQKVDLVERAGDPFQVVRVVVYATCT